MDDCSPENHVITVAGGSQSGHYRGRRSTVEATVEVTVTRFRSIDAHTTF